jgi:hypothetical protein
MAFKTPRWNHGLSHVNHVGHASPGDHHGIARRPDAWSASGLCCVWSEKPSECMMIQRGWTSKQRKEAMGAIDTRNGHRDISPDGLSLVKGQERYEEICQPHRIPIFPISPQNTDEHQDGRRQYDERVLYDQTNRIALMSNG